MAEPAHAEAGAAVSAPGTLEPSSRLGVVGWQTALPTGLCDNACVERSVAVAGASLLTGGCLGIKQEHDPTGLEAFDFNLSPELAAKRPYEEIGSGANQSPEAKRPRTENRAEEDSLEDGLALLVQNALSNVGDLVDQFNGTPDVPATSTEPMDMDSAPIPEPDREPATFSADPQRYIRDVNVHALGNLVRYAPPCVVESGADSRTTGAIITAHSGAAAARRNDEADKEWRI